MVQNDDGIQYESRSEMDVPLEILNLTEKERFMAGEKVGLCSDSVEGTLHGCNDSVEGTLHGWGEDRTVQ